MFLVLFRVCGLYSVGCKGRGRSELKGHFIYAHKWWQRRSQAENSSIHGNARITCYVYFLGRLPKVDLLILEGGNVRPSVRPQKVFFDFNEIWYVGRGR